MNGNFSQRQISLFKVLSSSEGFLTVAHLASRLQVSTRTILRELACCKVFLAEFNLSLEAVPGRGVRLTGSEPQRSFFHRWLLKEKTGMLLNAEDRRTLLKGCLLWQKDIIKLYTLAEYLEVAESTLSGDLEKMKNWFKERSLELVRRQGLGIYIKGSEIARRNALAEIFHQGFGEAFLRTLLFSSCSSSDSFLDEGNPLAWYFFCFFDRAFLKDVYKVVTDFSEKNGMNFSDNNCISLALHLAIALMRTETSDKILFTDEFENKSVDAFAYSQSALIAEALQDRLGITLPTSEICFIAMHLRASQHFAGREEEANFLLTARRILDTALPKSGYVLSDSPQNLVEALANHLASAVYRIKTNLVIRNPLLEEIKENHPDLLEQAHEAVKILEKEYFIAVPEAETAYLAMYLGAALKGSEFERRSLFRIAVACPSGMSTSILLSSRIKKQIEGIEIIDILSLREVSQKAGSKRYDLIVATENITAAVPCLVVSPLFPEEDQKRLEKALRNLSDAEAKPLHVANNWKDHLRKLNELSEGILQLLEGFFLSTAAVNTQLEAIKFAAQQTDESSQVLSALLEREKLGSVILSDRQLWFLHARGEGIRKLHLGVLRFERRLSMGESFVDTAIIMVAPKILPNSQLRLMQCISLKLAEDMTFVNRFKKGSLESLLNSIEIVLRKYMEYSM